MSECVLYMKVFGLAIDENGNKGYGGLKCSFGEFKPGCEQTYEQLTSKVHKEELPKLLGLEQFFKPDDFVIISPEEYKQNYGDD